MITNAFTYNGESELLELRMKILGEYVDEFIIIEFDKTFSGKSKVPYYEQDKHLVKKWKDKIKYFNYSEDIYFTDEYESLAKISPNVPKGGAENWFREFCQKESIKKTLTHLNDDDICFISDCDEIPDFGEPIIPTTEHPHRLDLKVYTYYLNNRSSEVFKGVLVSKYVTIKNECLNHLRSNTVDYVKNGGWHFTSLKDGLRRKLTDSYTTESYATNEVMDNLEDNIENSRDFLGRNFTYETSDIDLPQFIRDNRERYKHLFK